MAPVRHESPQTGLIPAVPLAPAGKIEKNPLRADYQTGRLSGVGANG